MGIIRCTRLDDLFKGAGAARNARPETVANPTQFADKRTSIQARDAMRGPAALRHLAEKLFRFGSGDVERGHGAILSIETHAKSPGALAKRGFATFEDVADRFADRSVLQPARHIANGRQTA